MDIDICRGDQFVVSVVVDLERDKLFRDGSAAGSTAPHAALRHNRAQQCFNCKFQPADSLPDLQSVHPGHAGSALSGVGVDKWQNGEIAGYIADDVRKKTIFGGPTDNNFHYGCVYGEVVLAVPASADFRQISDWNPNRYPDQIQTHLLAYALAHLQLPEVHTGSRLLDYSLCLHLSHH